MGLNSKGIHFFSKSLNPSPSRQHTKSRRLQREPFYPRITDGSILVFHKSLYTRVKHDQKHGHGQHCHLYVHWPERNSKCCKLDSLTAQSVCRKTFTIITAHHCAVVCKVDEGWLMKQKILIHPFVSRSCEGNLYGFVRNKALQVEREKNICPGFEIQSA